MTSYTFGVTKLSFLGGGVKGEITNPCYRVGKHNSTKEMFNYYSYACICTISCVRSRFYLTDNYPLMICMYDTELMTEIGETMCTH